VEKVWHVELAGPNPRDPTQEIYLPGARSRIYPQVGMPLFKTDKILGQRAIVSDTFDKGACRDANGRPYATADGGDCTTSEQTAKRAGYGRFGHGEAYNVLFGDGSARPFPDPNETIIWHSSGWDDEGQVVLGQWVDSLGGLNNFSSASFSGITRPDAQGNVGPGSRGAPLLTSAERFKNTANGIWHRFDTFNGIDADVE